MCGICGFVGFKDKELLRRMTDIIKHRGPDDEGFYTTDTPPFVNLGIRRLSIIDLSTGHQPIHNENKKLWIVLNGEIYNFLDLRADLEKKGHKFYTKTDTETIIHLYEDYGVNCLKYLRGAFAFAIWDENKKVLFLARDRIGKKPIYYASFDGSFIFASEIKSIIECQKVKKEIDLTSVHHFLTYQYIPSPSTIFKEIKKLPPASYIIFNEKKEIKIEKYWELDFTKKTILSFSEACEKIREILTQATRIRMISDVPLGAFLSGGHDSSIVVGLMSQLSSKPVKTFSIGFKEADFSEIEYARLVAKHFNTEHQEFVVESKMVDILPKLAWYYDQPYADSSALPTYIVSNHTRKFVTVALNGDGGDENFAGYLRYKAMKLAEITSFPFKILPKKLLGILLSFIPLTETVKAKSKIRYLYRFLSALKEPPALRNIIWHAYFTNEDKESIYSDEMREKMKGINSYRYLLDVFSNAKAETILDKTFYTDINTYLPECLTVKMDIATMANSLEARSPFLDHKLFEFTATLPDNWKLKGLTTKYILREVFKDFLPKEILRRGKQGFGIPVGKWFRHDLKDYIQQFLLEEKAIKRGYFKKEGIERLLKEHIGGEKDHGYRIWALLMLELWHRVFIDKEYDFREGI